jgi:hypothetical protein
MLSFGLNVRNGKYPGKIKYHRKKEKNDFAEDAST